MLLSSTPMDRWCHAMRALLLVIDVVALLPRRHLDLVRCERADRQQQMDADSAPFCRVEDRTQWHSRLEKLGGAVQD